MEEEEEEGRGKSARHTHTKVKEVEESRGSRQEKTLIATGTHTVRTEKAK